MPIQLSGSLVITGSITTTGVITMSGSIASASYSSTSDLLQGTGSVGFSTTASLFEVSSSQQQISASLLNVIANYATTGSNSFRATQSITGSLVVSSTITAQTLVVQTVTSSIVFSSGSNSFGNQLANNQTFTGSVNITGSLALAGNITGNAITLTGALSGTSATFSAGVTATGVGLNPSLKLTNTTASTGIDWHLYSLNNGNFGLYNNTAGAYALQVISTGQVGIGAAPNASFLLDIYQSLTSSTAYARIKNNRNRNAALQLETNLGNFLVGVGIGADTNQFQIYDNTAGANRLIIASTGAATLSSAGSVIPLKILNTTGTTLDMLVFETGWNAPSGNKNIIWKDATNTLGRISVSYDAPSATMRFGSLYNAGYQTSDLLTIASNGLVNINNVIASSSNYKLGVSGSGYINGSNDKGIFITDNATYASIVGLNSAISTYNPLEIRASGTDYQLYLATNGNVGIKTNNPSYSLSVNTGWIYNYGAQNASGFRYENNASGHVLNLNANNSYAQLYTGTTTALYFGSNNILSLGINTSGHVIAISDNAYTMGASGQRWSAIWSANGTIQTSDEREKKDITNTDLGLDFISNLRPVCYKWKVGQNIVTREPDGLDENGNEQFKIVKTPREGTRVHYGLIAQEVKQVLGDKDFGGYIHDEDTDIKGLRYDQFIAPLIKAIQELSAKVTALETK